MPDITQEGNPHLVTFSANSVRADLWMRTHYADQLVSFELPTDHKEANEFKERALAEGFTFAIL